MSAEPPRAAGPVQATPGPDTLGDAGAAPAAPAGESGLARQVQAQQQRIAELEAELAESEKLLGHIEQSTVWRTSAPLRRFFSTRPGAARLLRRLAQALGGKPAPPRPPVQPAQAAGRFAALVPFAYLHDPPDRKSGAGQPAATPQIAVIGHLYYPDLAGELRRHLAHIPYPYDLYLSTDSGAKQRELEDWFAPGSAGAPRRLEVKVVENRGRDIAPKLLNWDHAYASHDYVLHVHGKKSTYAGGQLGHWRSYLWQSLLGSPAVVASVFEAFGSDPQLGMIAPDHLAAVRGGLGWASNFAHAKALARRLGMDLAGEGWIDFPSGSMFWARSAALRPLLDCGLTLRDFEPEAGQNDGTLAHAIERLYFFCCEKAGLAWMKIAPAALPGLQLGEARDIASPQALAQFLAGTRLWLTRADGGTLQAGCAPASPGPGEAEAAAADPQLHAAWRLSGHQAMAYADFAAQVGRLAAGAPNSLDFDDAFYRAAHADVARAVARGRYGCGYVHFCLEGRAQGRLWSDGELQRRFGLAANFPAGLLRPAHLAPLPVQAPALARAPLRAAPFLLVMVGHLQEDLFFAGYQALFGDLAPALGRYGRIVVAVDQPHFEPQLARRYSERIEVIHASGLATLASRPSVTVCMDHALFLQACELFGDAGRVVYYCQDFESGFHPYSARYVRAETAISRARWLVVSTAPLEDFLRRRGLIAGQRVLLTAPRIEALQVAPEPRRRLFFYFRPETFHSRNLPETVLAAVRKFCARHAGYEIYLMGSVATRYSYADNGNRVFVISKLPAAQYQELLASCDAAVALIYSAHPGVIAFQAAASGIPTVTNTFDNRDGALLTRMSANFVPFDPVRDDLADKVEEALARPKGVPSFNAALYAGPPAPSLADFLDEVQRQA